MSNVKAAEQLNNLKVFGTQPENTDYIAQEYFVRDTIGFAPSTELVPTPLFLGNDNKDKMYRSSQFPSNTQAFKITHLQASTDLLFTAADPEEQRAKFAHFINFSEFVITKDGKEVLRIGLREMVDFTITSTGGKYAMDGTDVVYQATELRQKFNNRYKLLNDIEIPAGVKLEFEIVPAKGLTTNATGLYHPNLGLSNNKGFILDVTLTAVKVAGANV